MLAKLWRVCGAAHISMLLLSLAAVTRYPSARMADLPPAASAAAASASAAATSSPHADVSLSESELDSMRVVQQMEAEEVEQQVRQVAAARMAAAARLVHQPVSGLADCLAAIAYIVFAACHAAACH